MRNKISVVMITLNSEKYLRESLSSCEFADEVLIVDAGSTDATLEIAGEFGVKVFLHPWQGFGRQIYRRVFF